jgi:predicted AlkP superfamily pyrophosphatase or phosphodiesterase
MAVTPLVLIDAVGLTTRWLAHAPRLRALASAGWMSPLEEIVPAVTCSAQASMLTGKAPRDHGIVANGWLFRETGEIRFWQQSNFLLQAEPVYATARRMARDRGRSLRIAKLFWWFNQGAAIDISVTPKPYYGADGNKVFGITGTPEDLPDRLERALGKFPFHTFWGPSAGLPCTQWIAQAAARILSQEHPDLLLIYLPHLDYDPQRYGPSHCDMPRLIGELDAACEPLLDEARTAGARVWVVSEYGHCDVSRPVLPNRVLRKARLLSVRPGPFGEMLDTFASQAFAVCDHQLAHVYVAQGALIQAVADQIREVPGVSRVLAGPQRAEVGLDHPRSGELIILSEPDSWFAYAYWLDDRHAPDFARTVDIHRKPGYDPCELFFDPGLPWAKGRVLRRLVQKKLGFRTLFDVVPLDPTLVRGSHGLPAQSLEDKPLLIADGPRPQGRDRLAMTEVRRLVLEALISE